jgi:hypothetical protein
VEWKGDEALGKSDWNLVGENTIKGGACNHYFPIKRLLVKTPSRTLLMMLFCAYEA